MKKVFFLLIIILAVQLKYVKAQLIINTSNSQVNMIKSLEGVGVKFSNITIDCPGTDQMAEFDGTLSNITMDEGVLLTTGSAIAAIGPSNNTAAIRHGSSLGDDDLDSISASTTMDACIVNFDFQSNGDSVKFDFIFASEEYPQFINSSINDVFGFFISGPGINGDFTNNAENIATLPDGVTPVSIRNINNGTNNNGPCTNCQYYIDNTPNEPNSVVYNGFTTTLTASYGITPCTSYHLKMVIADTKDDNIDSGVFLKAGSFKSKSAVLVAKYTDTYEECQENELLLYKTSGNDSVNVKITLGGSATNGIDYGFLNQSGVLTAIPTELTIPANQNVYTKEISIPNDNITEGTETMIIYVSNTDCFGNFGESDSIVVNINEHIPVEINSKKFTCLGDSIILDVSSTEKNLFFFWEPNFTLDSTSSTHKIKIEESSQIIVSVKDTFGCIGTDTTYVNVSENSKSINFTYQEYEIKNSNKVVFFPDTIFSSSAKYIWNIADSIFSTKKNPTYTFNTNGPHLINLNVVDDFTDSCSYTISQYIEFDDLKVPNIITPNEDGINDYFLIPNLYKYSFQIFDQWGNLIINEDEYKNDFKADGVPDGIYFYTINTETTLYKGWLQIIR